MGEHAAFFYGTLMAPAVLSRVCHGMHSDVQSPLLNVRPALLHHYRRHKVRHADYPGIVPEPGTGSSVRGALVTGLTDGDIWRLDIFEGDEYERRAVKVHVLTTVGDDAGEGNVESEEGIECETYVWTAGKERLEDEEWDFAEFKRDKMWRWAGTQSDEQGEYQGRDSYRRQ